MVVENELSRAYEKSKKHKINYDRLVYTTLGKVASVAIEKVLKKANKSRDDISDVAWTSNFNNASVLFFFKNGEIWKFNTRAEVIRMR